MTTDWAAIRVGIQNYQWIMNNFRKVDVSKDREFQKRFNGFYRMRQRSREFYNAFYTKLEASKKGKCPTFEEVLDYLWVCFETIEPSFSSKLIATVNPDNPIWDQRVLNNLHLRKPRGHGKDAATRNQDRLGKTKKLYEEITKWYLTDEANKKLAEFNKNIPNAVISDTKKIDFVLWQTK